MGASELLDRAVEAHGGLARFEATEQVAADVRISGWALPMRFKRGALADYTATAWTHEPRAVLDPYTAPGRRGVFDRDDVRVEAADGAVLEERRNARDYFRGRRAVWWDDLDLLYFAGYAFWGYVVAPFIFTRPGYEIAEVEPWRENGEEWPGLRVRYPDDVPAHSREQHYYFGPDGLIRRNDYTAEVFGRWARATHYCWDYRDYGGFKIPTRRRAMVRRPGGKPIRAITVVGIAIDDVRPQ